MAPSPGFTIRVPMETVPELERKLTRITAELEELRKECVMKYRKKPVVIEAIEWTGKNLKEIIDFTGQHPSVSHLSWSEYEKLVADKGLKIFTLEGSHMATIGDYIIKGVKGECYPCKPDIFEQTYDPVESVT